MAHIHETPGQIDNTIAAYIVHKKSVLLVDHKQLKMWLPIGGHIELDEDPEEALFREIFEESGITQVELELLGEKPTLVSEGIKFLTPPTYLDIHTITSTHRHIGNVYFLRSHTDQITLAENEHNAIEWISEDKLIDPKFGLFPAVRFYALDAIKRLGWD